MFLNESFQSNTQRKQYKQRLEQLVSQMQTCLMSFFTGHSIDLPRWSQEFTNTYETVKELEKSKADYPCYSQFCAELATRMRPLPNKPRYERKPTPQLRERRYRSVRRPPRTRRPKRPTLGRLRTLLPPPLLSATLPKH